MCFLKENLGSSWQNFFSYFNTQQANATQTADLRQSPNQTIYLNLFVLTASKNPSKRRLKSVFFQTSYPYLDFSYFFLLLRKESKTKLMWKQFQHKRCRPSTCNGVIGFRKLYVGDRIGRSSPEENRVGDVIDKNNSITYYVIRLIQPLRGSQKSWLFNKMRS